MKLLSKAFIEGKRIPTLYTCDGKELSPELTIQDVPSTAKSLALIMDDPDVPEFVRKDRLWVHWVIFNMPAKDQTLAEGKPPPGTLGKNTSGTLGYQGPCPPDREHRYFFKLYALDTLLTLKEGASKADVEKAMQGHVVAEASLMGRYLRS